MARTLPGRISSSKGAISLRLSDRLPGTPLHLLAEFGARPPKLTLTGYISKTFGATSTKFADNLCSDALQLSCNFRADRSKVKVAGVCQKFRPVYLYEIAVVTTELYQTTTLRSDHNDYGKRQKFQKKIFLSVFGLGFVWGLFGVSAT